MQSKRDRHRTILALIARRKIRTQRQLQEALEQEGHPVNQATLSRDITELALIKTTIGGVPRYVKPETISTTTTTKPTLGGLSRFVRGIDSSRNIIVMRTDSGAASHVAEGLDNAGIDELIGTIAGDNTIMIIVRETVPASEIVIKLKKLLDS